VKTKCETQNSGQIKKHLLIELILIIMVGIVVFFIASYFDVFEQMAKFTEQYENFELDEFISLSFYFSVILALFSIRRWKELQKAHQVLAEQNEQLQKALSKIKYLKGIVPICAVCKNIRNDKGYWLKLETYLLNHSEAELSHGLCPECMAEMLKGEELE